MLLPTVLASALIVRSVHGYAYQGCINFSTAPTGTDLTPVAAVLNTCLATCTSSGYSVGYYQASPYHCRCSDTSPAVYEPAQDSSGTCSDGQASSFLLDIDYTFDGCASRIDTSGPTHTSFTSSVSTCFATCDSYRYASFSHLDGVSVCQCFNAIASETATTCDSNSSTSIYVYEHAPQAAASAAVRRQLKRRLEDQRRTINAYCPAGLSSCALPGDADAFECVDTQSDLESCGGCMNGAFDPITRAPAGGVNCSSLPGVALGGVTCARGECLVSACKLGYKLVNNRCV
ncbi:hypothetical protein CI109_105169 [Kwoniella shandongensis]|uniref:Uncharacterized protein n=1 Tax=Kwoniella shandongensis TaxID=1734106 RepID=A0A5M6C3P9_9TREE|nr:uncharacterized protein CI109_002008 [Kwoniella shandongensis]KAA5529583.1 hypothetical protein CI109_002008 [Kwoniella shandongensis]